MGDPIKPVDDEIAVLLVDVLMQLYELEERIREALKDMKKPPEQPDPFFDEIPW